MKLTEEELEKINKRQSDLKRRAAMIIQNIATGNIPEHEDGELMDYTRSQEILRKEINELELKKLHHYRAVRKEKEEKK